MIELLPLKYELKKYVEIAYNGDEDLLKKYHIAEYSLCEAVDETLSMIYQTSLEVDMKHLGVYNDCKIIGYVSYFQNNLYSFGINIEYRTKEVLSVFWEEIKSILSHSFICMLYPNNTRAIEWLKKCGMKEKECVILLYNN